MLSQCRKGFKWNIARTVEKKQLFVLFFQIIVDINSKDVYYIDIVTQEEWHMGVKVFLNNINILNGE